MLFYGSTPAGISEAFEVAPKCWMLYAMMQTLGAGTGCLFLWCLFLGLGWLCFACICFVIPPSQLRSLRICIAGHPHLHQRIFCDSLTICLLAYVQPGILSAKCVAWVIECVSVWVGNVWLCSRARCHHGGGPAAAAGQTIGAKDRGCWWQASVFCQLFLESWKAWHHAQHDASHWSYEVNEQLTGRLFGWTRTSSPQIIVSRLWGCSWCGIDVVCSQWSAGHSYICKLSRACCWVCSKRKDGYLL